MRAANVAFILAPRVDQVGASWYAGVARCDDGSAFIHHRVSPLKLPTPAPNSLFAILVRSPFWVSLLLAIGTYVLAQNFVPPVFAVATTLPWIGTAAFAGWRQLKTPSVSRVTKMLEQLGAMSWPQFSAVMSEIFRADGYSVATNEDGVVSLVLERTGYTTLAACRRWKVKETGIVPLRELADAATARGARDCVYVTTGTFTDNAQAFARQQKIRLLNGMELARLAAPILNRKST